MNSYFVVLCLMAVAASANPILPLVPITTLGHIDNPNYNFNYAVNDPHTGDNKAQWESRHGDSVRGAYSLVEPDGSVRVVEYHADPHTGFNAVVKKIGENVHSVAPLVAPIAHHVAPIAHHVAPIAHGPLLAPGPIPLAYPPLIHTPIITHEPIIVHEPIIAHEPLLPLYHEPAVHVSGSTYGHHGLESHWSAGPIHLGGKSLIIRHKH